MKRTIAVAAAILVAFVALANNAEAGRKLSAKDKAVAKQAMKYVGQIAVIIDAGIKKPKPAIAKLRTYLKKNKASLHKLGKKMEAIEKELTPEAKQELQTWLQTLPEMKKMMKAMMGFFQAHGQNKAIMDEMQKLMQEMEPPKG